MANLLIPWQTRQKRRILPDTMIQEIGRSVKCQKLNKFINRTPILSVNKPKARRGDQFPGDPRWLSGQAGTFYPLTVLSRRNLTPRQTRPTSRDCQGIAPRRGAPLKCGRNLRFPTNAPSLKCPLRGDQFPGIPRWLSGHAGTFYPLTAPPAGRKFFQMRAARHTATIHSSLFTILFPLAPPGGIPRPSIPTPLPGIAKELLPAGALSPPGHGPCPGCVRVGLACPQILSANCSPQGQGGFPISWGYDKISAGAVGARFYTNKSGAKENHLCRELWVWPGRPLQNMI